MVSLFRDTQVSVLRGVFVSGGTMRLVGVVISAVLPLVPLIATRRVISQVRQAIIGWVAVVVADLHTSGAGSEKRRGDKHMNFVLVLIAEAQAGLAAPVRGVCLLEHDSSCKPVAAIDEGDGPVKATDPSIVTDLVQALIADDGKPVLTLGCHDTSIAWCYDTCYRWCMNTYEEILERVARSHSLGDGYELREAKRWTVHCTHCGVQLIGDTPQTEKAFAALQRSVGGRECRNPNCVSRGGTERRSA
jgi:hypothetical protein